MEKTDYLLLLLSIAFNGILCVPPLNHPVQLPQNWQDDWIVGLTNSQLKITGISLDLENESLFIIELQNFLNEWSIITADANKRCNLCHVISELHANVLTKQTSDCQSQVSP